jgi:hypothetical protein
LSDVVLDATRDVGHARLPHGGLLRLPVTSASASATRLLFVVIVKVDGHRRGRRVICGNATPTVPPRTRALRAHGLLHDDPPLDDALVV